jgi:hypothetical protein
MALQKLADAVEKVPNRSTANFLPKDETRGDCLSICPQKSLASFIAV